MADKFKYTAFISYSHADKAVVERLHRALEGYKIPKTLVGRETPQGKVPEKFKPFFRDRDDLSAATNLSASIKKAMKQSQFLIVVCSPNAAASEWVAKEINEFKKLRSQNQILCLIVGGDLKGEKQPFPEALWEGLSAKEKKSYQPVAADARPSGDGKRLAKLKLISGLLGIELDSLIQRETKRRQVQVSILAGVFTVAILVLSVLLYVATEARKEAVANRLEAEERQFQAEKLIEFMLGDLRQNLAPIGNLQIMDTIAIQALGYYASIDPEKMTAEALSRRSEVLLMLGEVQIQRGNSKQAKSAFMEAFFTTEEMLARDPENSERIFDHSQSVFWLAYLNLLQGDFDQAEKQFQLYEEFATNLAQKDPGNLDYQMEVGYAHSNLGTLFSRQGKYPEAEEKFLSQLLIFQKLAENDPDSEFLKYDLAQSFAWLSDSQLSLGKLQLAKEQRLKELAINEELLEPNPQNNNIRGALLVTHNMLGTISAYLGENNAALFHFKKGIEIGESLVAFDQENTDFIEQLARLILDYLELLKSNDSQVENQPLIDRTRTLTLFLLERDETGVDWTILHNRSLLVEAKNLFKAGKFSEGLEIAETANTEMAALWENDKNTYNILGRMGFAALILAEGYELMGTPLAANQVLETFVESAKPFENKITIREQELLARAWLKLGFVEKALQKQDFFNEIGYHNPAFSQFIENWETKSE